MDQQRGASKEPDWTKNISSKTVCDFFYIFFIIYAVLAGIALLGMLVTVFTVKLPKGLMFASIFSNLLVMAVSGTMALFHYLVCTRALGA
jgi:hypothetical protein